MHGRSIIEAGGLSYKVLSQASGEEERRKHAEISLSLKRTIAAKSLEAEKTKERAKSAEEKLMALSREIVYEQQPRRGAQLSGDNFSF